MSDATLFPGALDDDSTLVTEREGFVANLTAPIDADDVSLPIGDTTGIVAPGLALIRAELILFTGTTATDLTGCTRGLFPEDGGSPPLPHDSGALVQLATTANSAALRAVIHRTQNDALREVEAKLGAGASAPTTPGDVLTVTAAGETEYAAPTGGGSSIVVADTATVDLELLLGTLTAAVIPGGISHDDLADVGTNDHAAIDAHIASTANPHAVTKAQVGLGSVPNVDATDRANHTGTQLAATVSDFSSAADARIAAAAGVSIASLVAGKVPTSQIPALGLVTVQTAVSQAAQLALTTQEGDVVVRTDENKTYMRNAGVTGTMTDFTLLNTPTDLVTSVNGQVGTVVLARGDVGLGNVDNTSDVNKPVSTAQAAALALKSDTTHVHVYDAGTLTIASDTVTLPAIPVGTTFIRCRVDTQAAAATDDLSKILETGTLPEGTLLLVQSANFARVPTLRGTFFEAADGGIYVNSGALASIIHQDYGILLRRNSASGFKGWVEVSRSPGRAVNALADLSDTGALASPATGDAPMWSGAAWVLAQAAGAGVVPIGNPVVFSGVSSVPIDGRFTSAFRDYTIKLSITAATSTSAFLQARLRAGGSDAAVGNYDYERHRGQGALHDVFQGLNLNQWSELAYFGTGPGVLRATTIHLFSPALAQETNMTAEFVLFSDSAMFLYHLGGRHRLATAYDGITLIAGAGTMTGTAYIFGWA